MTDNSLVPVPDSEDRRAAARRSRMERRQRAIAQRAEARELAEAKGKEAAPVERPEPAPPVPEPKVATNPRPVQRSQPGGGQQGRGQPVTTVRPESFMLPPRAQVEKTVSRFSRLLKASFVVCVVAPTIVAILFYVFVASDQYATESSFAVRGSTTSSTSIDVSSMLGLGSAATNEASDSFIVQNYILSREMVQTLISEANFLEVYSRPSADPYYRLDPNLPIESLVDYWNMMASVEFDTDTGIMTLIVRAFRPSDAEAITRKVLEKSEALVNELSLRAREDSLKSARREVEIAEERFANARKAVAAYRGDEREIDPSATATSQQELIGELEAEVSRKESELAALRSTMSENAPRVVYVQNQIDALRRQIATERLSVAVAREGTEQQPALTERLSRYEELLAEREFAEKAYISTLAALEAARVEALKQQRYLAVFVRGEEPQSSLYPEAIRWTLILFGSLFGIWGIMALVGSAVRDRVV